MRQITEDSSLALRNNYNFKKSNMRVKEGNLFLHDNLIAYKTGNRLTLTDAGWRTSTTKERLNGILTTFCLPYAIYQKNFIWYLWNLTDDSEIEWSGRQTFKL